MKIQRTCLNWIGGILCLAAAGAVAIQADRIAGLRGANQGLRNSEKEAAELSRQNQEMPRLRQETAAIAELRAANQGLLALRNEIHQLRSGKEELAEARADNQLLLDQQRASSGQQGTTPPPADLFQKRRWLIRGSAARRPRSGPFSGPCAAETWHAW